jgi:aminotransferase in exopolysaccharide biosynthesis
MPTEFKKIIDFIRELYNTPEGFIPLHAPVFRGNEKKYLEECIDTTFVSSVGKFVDQFEIGMAKYTGAAKAVACVNGTNALHLALLLVGVERDTEVITQPLTFIATANAISYCGARPVFLDVDLDTMGLSPSALKKWLETSTSQLFNSSTSKLETYNKITGKRISACVPMHTFGHPARIDEIVAICNEYNIPVVEDAAESLGSFYSPREIRETNISQCKGQHTGTFGEIGVLSFNGNKTITTGGGGMLLFNDDALAKQAKHLTTQAKVPHPWEFVHNDIGYNYRMPNINAALGLAQLERLNIILEKKRKTAEKYIKFFDAEGIAYITEPENCRSNYWLNCILLKDRNQRDEFLKFANVSGIMSRPAWRLMNELEMFIDCETDKMENAKHLSDRLVNIPSSFIL